MFAADRLFESSDSPMGGSCPGCTGRNRAHPGQNVYAKQHASAAQRLRPQLHSTYRLHSLK